MLEKLNFCIADDVETNVRLCFGRLYAVGLVVVISLACFHSSAICSGAGCGVGLKCFIFFWHFLHFHVKFSFPEFQPEPKLKAI